MKTKQGKGVKCYNCQQFGHRAFQCTNEKKERTDSGEKEYRFKASAEHVASKATRQRHAEKNWQMPIRLGTGLRRERQRNPMGEVTRQA
jgi:hypothetical protein